MKTIIAGSRSVTSYAEVCAAVEGLAQTITEVVSGTARGVDQLGERWAKEHGVPVVRFPAEWNTHGRGAGYIRNSTMAIYADALIAVWDGESRGTKNMIQEAQKRGLLVHIHQT